MTQSRQQKPARSWGVLAFVLALFAADAHALERVAVLEFTAEPAGSVNANVLEGLADETRRAAVDVLRGANWLVITREAQEAVMRDNGVDMAKVCMAECEVDVARTVGAALLVTGSVKKIGSSYHLYLKVFHAERGQVLKITKLSSKSVEDLFDKCYDAAVATMREAVPEAAPPASGPAAQKSPQKIHDTYVGATSTTPSAGARSPVVVGSTPTPTGKPWAGLDMLELDDREQRMHGSGVRVVDVVEGGPAARAGLLYGDVIASIDGVSARDPATAVAALVRKKPGETVLILVNRGDQRVSVALTLGVRPIDDGAGTPFVGLDLEDLSSRERRSYGSGARVSGVKAGGPADRAGLEPDDIITAVDGRDIEDAVDGVERFRMKKPGDLVRLSVVRDGDERSIRMTIGSKGGGIVAPASASSPTNSAP